MEGGDDGFFALFDGGDAGLEGVDVAAEFGCGSGAVDWGRRVGEMLWLGL